MLGRYKGPMLSRHMFRPMIRERDLSTRASRVNVANVEEPVQDAAIITSTLLIHSATTVVLFYSDSMHTFIHLQNAFR